MKSGSSNVSTTYLAGIRSPDELKTSRLGPSRDHATVVCETFHTVSLERLYDKSLEGSRASVLVALKAAKWRFWVRFDRS
jgi:hypothetical protein